MHDRGINDYKPNTNSSHLHFSVISKLPTSGRLCGNSAGKDGMSGHFRHLEHKHFICVAWVITFSNTHITMYCEALQSYRPATYIFTAVDLVSSVDYAY